MNFDSLFRESTPIEKFKIKNKAVYVKRDDLFGSNPAPQLGKLRGLKVVLDSLNKRKINLVGCWDTRVSRLGQGVAVICNEYPDMNAIISYPIKKGEPIPEAIQIAKDHGSEIYPIRGNHVSICYSQVTKYVEQRGGYMLPFGLECIESVNEISKEAGNIPKHCVHNGTLVITCGSGVTLAGIINGIKYEPNLIVGISSGRSIKNIHSCLVKYVKDIPRNLCIEEATMPYYTKCTFHCPFPSDPYYDLKAWRHLVENIDNYKEPILFWNIGS